MSYLKTLIGLVYPPRCPGCLKMTDDLLCPECAAQVPQFADRICNFCGKPTLVIVARCRDCREKTLYFDSARALWAYEGIARDIVHAFKYGNQKSLAYALGERLASLSVETNIITWVPLTRKKRWSRGYNQAHLLARRLSSLLGVPHAALLRRTRQTQDQNRLDLRGRKANIQNAFGPLNSDITDGAAITLVDDVYTSGSTVAECAKVLKENGAVSVHVLTLARTLLNK